MKTSTNATAKEQGRTEGANAKNNISRGKRSQTTKNDVGKPSSNLPTLCKNLQFSENDFWKKIDGSENSTRTLSEQFTSTYADQSERSLMVFIDGTGNIAASNTNIWKLYSLASLHACSAPVIPYYHQGLGTKWGNKIAGSITGAGIDKHIKETYQFLAETYKPGDKIHIFGFSRGAYTARALNGMVEYAGLLNTSALSLKSKENGDIKAMIDELFNIYRKSNDGEALFSTRFRSEVESLTSEYPIYRGRQKVVVNTIGVFDTVPALGASRDDNPDEYRTELYAKKGLHAIALDEQRDDFRALRFDDRISKEKSLSQVWFSGAHADVGGGYQDDRGLSNVSLQWMLKKFRKDNVFPDIADKLKCDKSTANCEYGELHDEFLANFKLYGKFGIHMRKPRKDEILHRSILCRFNHGVLPEPNLKREPKGYYRPENVYLPLEKNYNFADYKCADGS